MKIPPWNLCWNTLPCPFDILYFIWRPPYKQSTLAKFITLIFPSGESNALLPLQEVGFQLLTSSKVRRSNCFHLTRKTSDRSVWSSLGTLADYSSCKRRSKSLGLSRLLHSWHELVLSTLCNVLASWILIFIAIIEHGNVLEDNCVAVQDESGCTCEFPN